MNIDSLTQRQDARALRAERVWLLARHDSGAIAPQVYAIIKVLEVENLLAGKGAGMKKIQQPKKRYEPKPPPANSFVTSKSPLSNTKRVSVMRFHSYHGVPIFFLVCDKNGRELRRFEYEPDALAHCEALEAALIKEESVDEAYPG